jgi:chromosome segregation ATPase
MPRKSKTAPRDSAANPLETVEPFEPGPASAAHEPPASVADKLESPLGQAATTIAGMSSVELLLREANNRIEALRSELAQERQQRRELEKSHYRLEAQAARADEALAELATERSARLELERKVAVMDSEIKMARSQLKNLDEERSARIEMERKIGSLEFRAEKADELAKELAEERGLRIDLERERATLEQEVHHGAKLEQMLTEERQARASAQMRASTAEARLAKLEGEQANQSKGRGGLFGRSR